MRAFTTWIATLGLCAFATFGCSSSEGTTSESEADVIARTGGKLDDAKLVTALKKALVGQVFVSEGDEPWTVVQGDGKGVKVLDAKTINQRLGKIIEPLDRKRRDLSKVRSDEEAFDEFFDGLEDGGEGPDEAYSKVRKLMKTNLTDLHVVHFDVQENGDQGTGPIVIVVVGKSATDKLIALVTFAVAT